MKTIMAALSAILMLIFYPAIVFGVAYIGGIVFKMCAGETIANGLNLLFNTNRFTSEFIPLACATLATIGSYFKSTQINN